MKIRIESSDRMSNTKYHAYGKPNWWARIGYDQFLAIPQVRGDVQLEVDVEVPDDTEAIYIGVGPRNKHGIRETIYIA